jgi:hypothetical protein
MAKPDILDLAFETGDFDILAPKPPPEKMGVGEAIYEGAKSGFTGDVLPATQSEEKVRGRAAEEEPVAYGMTRGITSIPRYMISAPVAGAMDAFGAFKPAPETPQPEEPTIGSYLKKKLFGTEEPKAEPKPEIDPAENKLNLIRNMLVGASFAKAASLFPKIGIAYTAAQWDDMSSADKAATVGGVLAGGVTQLAKTPGQIARKSAAYKEGVVGKASGTTKEQFGEKATAAHEQKVSGLKEEAADLGRQSLERKADIISEAEQKSLHSARAEQRKLEAAVEEAGKAKRDLYQKTINEIGQRLKKAEGTKKGPLTEAQIDVQNYEIPKTPDQYVSLDIKRQMASRLGINPAAIDAPKNTWAGKYLPPREAALLAEKHGFDPGETMRRGIVPGEDLPLYTPARPKTPVDTSSSLGETRATAPESPGRAARRGSIPKQEETQNVLGNRTEPSPITEQYIQDVKHGWKTDKKLLDIESKRLASEKKAKEPMTSVEGQWKQVVDTTVKKGGRELAEAGQRSFLGLAKPSIVAEYITNPKARAFGYDRISKLAGKLDFLSPEKADFLLQAAAAMTRPGKEGDIGAMKTQWFLDNNPEVAEALKKELQPERYGDF